MSSSNLIRCSGLAAAVGGLVIGVCLICAAGTARAHNNTGLVEAHPLYGSYDLALKVSAAEETPSVAQTDTGTTAAELKTQSVVEAEPDPEEAQRNVGGGNAPAWFLIALGLVVAVILALGLLRRRR